MPMGSFFVRDPRFRDSQVRVDWWVHYDAQSGRDRLDLRATATGLHMVPASDGARAHYPTFEAHLRKEYRGGGHEKAAKQHVPELLRHMKRVTFARDRRRSRDTKRSRSSPALSRALRAVEEAWAAQYANTSQNADVYIRLSNRIHAAMNRAFHLGATQIDIDRAMDRAIARRREPRRGQFVRGGRRFSSRLRSSRGR